MRTNITLKTKTMSILLAIVMLFGMLPMSVFAADESTVITITNDNMNDASDAYLVDDSTLLLGGGIGMGGTHSFMLGPNPDGGAFTFLGVDIGGFSTVRGGKAAFRSITNLGTISGGSFDPDDSGDLYVENRDTGAISGGTFNGNRVNKLFVENYGSISGGTFYGKVINSGIITDGTFEGEVTSRGTITSGTFNGVVINTGTISGGTFSKGILNGEGGTIADGVNATVAQGGDLAITMQTLGTGSITVKQKGIDIPSGKAGETYNVAASGGTLVGLYMLTEGETVPTENYTIESDFRAVAAGFGGYDFTMPNEAVTIVAVFDGYVPTEISIWPHIIKGTDAASLEEPEWIDYGIASLTSFTEEITLPGDVVPGYITVGGERYDFAGFIMSEYDEATDTVSYSLSQTLTIAAEPAQGTEEWDEWYTPISDGLMAAYMLHTHSYSAATCTTPATCSCGATTGGVDSTNHTGGTEVRNQKDATEFEDGYTGDTYCLGCNTMIEQGEVIGATHTHNYVTKSDDSGHWTECSCEDKTTAEPHTYSDDADTACDCGYTRTVELPVTVTGKDTTITYTPDGFDLSGMFTIDPNAGAATYTVISGGTGVGTVNGTKLSITKSGTFVIKVATAKNGVYLPGEATATLTVEKATPEYTVPGPFVLNTGDYWHDIELPDGFTWEGTRQRMPCTSLLANVIYTPEDTDNYEVVELNVEIQNMVESIIVTPVGNDIEKVMNVFADGKIVNATVKVDFRNENEVPVGDATLIRDYAKENFSGKSHGIEWMDISVTGEDGKRISELDAPLAFGVDMEGRKVLGVVSVHDGGLISYERYGEDSGIHRQEMTDSKKNNILVEAAGAMLAQANMMPQNVLSLLYSTYAIIYEVEPTPDTPSSPQTGDNSHILTWIALLFISGGAVISLTVYDRKRRKNTV